MFGVDVSNHQRSFNFAGWEFAFLKATEGSTFKDRMFQTHLANARAQNCVVAAYHYQRGEVSASAQFQNIVSMVPKDIPVIIDVENDSGGVDLTRNIIELLRREGYRIGPLYLPRWYWDRIGRPNLAGLPNLWASWYPDYVARPPQVGLSLVPSSAWASYGGNRVEIMQFTSTPFDQNFYAGNRSDLLRLLEQDVAPPVEEPEPIVEEEVFEMVSGYVKGDQMPHVYYVEADLAGVKRRHVEEPELICALSFGAKLGVVSQAALDALPKVEGSV